MTDGGTEVRRLSFQADASQLRDSLISGGRALDKFNGAVGKTDSELRRVERQVEKASATMRQAALTAQRMKESQKALSQALTKSRNEAKQLGAQLTSTTRKLAEQKAIVSAQKNLILALTRQNANLAASYNGVATAATRAATAQARAAASTNKGRFAPLGQQFATAPQLGVSGGVITKDGTANLKAFGQQLQNSVQFSNALRYQLYDVSATLGIVGAAATYAGTAIFRTGIEWDKNFANVVRTSQVTGQAVNWLKNEFLDLQSAIPVTSEDLATIGTLGAQMGVAAGELANFTETTAQFSATSGTSVDEAATALSRLDQLLPDVEGNYERLASTILKTGVNAVATEQQIVRGTSQIAAMGRIAGLTTPEIVALSSTLSSLGFSPELQRSIVTSSFSKILTATSTVTAATEKFGAVLNLTGKEFQTAWNEDALGTYERLMKTIASRGDAVTVLQSLGLASQRLTPNLLKLGQNTEVLDEALGDTTQGWAENIELQRQYGIISRTVAARIQVLGQSWEAFLVTLDESDTVVGPIVDGLTQVVHLMTQFARNPGVSTLATVGSTIGIVAGVTALAAAGLAAMAGGYIALFNAQQQVSLLLAEHAALEAADTAATGANTAAKIANSGAMVTNGAAVTGNTAALAGNAAASNAAAVGMLNFSSKAIAALPAIIKWTGIVGLAIAAATGLYTAVATVGDWTLDLDKMVNGVDNVPETLNFDVERLKKNQADIEYWKKEVASGKWEFDGKPSKDGFVVDQLHATQDAAKPIFQDLEDSILELTDNASRLKAVNDVSQALGITQSELLERIPGVASVLGDQAVAMAEAAAAAEKLASAQSLWAASLGSSDEDLTSLMDGVQSAAGQFLDFGEALTNAYDTSGDPGTGGGLGAFLKGMKDQIKDFQSFYGDLGTLVRKGGVQLAGFFAEQGPGAAQALTDSLKLNGAQISQIEEQMSLAAFYASDAFKQTFAQNNSILAQVWEQSGHNPEAVAAFNKVLADSMTGGTIDPAALAAVMEKFHLNGIPIDLIPSIDPADFEQVQALSNATITPVKVPIITEVGGVPTNLDEWVVTMEGHSIVLPVDPNTAEGAALLAEWRANEYQTPVSLRSTVQTTGAAAQLQAFYDSWKNRSITFRVATSYAYNSGSVGGIPSGVPGGATGALVGQNRLIRGNYPGFKNGTVLRGAGTGTSDSMLARVSTGEAITRAAAVRYYGADFMEAINRMQLPRFAGGGIVGGGSSSSGPIINATVVQNYPTTRDPIKTLKRDAENVIAGIWS